MRRFSYLERPLCVRMDARRSNLNRDYFLPMAKQGRAAVALFMAAVASMVGSPFGITLVSGFAPVLAQFALQFRAAEFFSLMLFALLGASAIGNDVQPGHDDDYLGHAPQSSSWAAWWPCTLQGSAGQIAVVALFKLVLHPLATFAFMAALPGIEGSTPRHGRDLRCRAHRHYGGFLRHRQRRHLGRLFEGRPAVPHASRSARTRAGDMGKWFTVLPVSA
jgi:hypothetical protein